MVWFLLADASAQCSLAHVTSSLPHDWDGGVPPEVVITLAVDPFRLPVCTDPSLFTLDGPWPAAFDVEAEGALVRLRPRAPLGPGLWSAGGGGELVRFTVADSPRELVPAPPATIEVAVTLDCEGAVARSELDLTAHFPSPPDGEGMIEAFAIVDGHETSLGAQLYRGSSPLAHFGRVYEGHPEICARVRATDWYGETTWETDVRCADEPACPWEDDLDGVLAEEEGCGCRSGGSAGLLALLTLPAWRARARGASRRSRPRGPRS